MPPNRMQWLLSTSTRIRSKIRAGLRALRGRADDTSDPASARYDFACLCRSRRLHGCLLPVSTRSAELENFHLAGPTGRSYSIESFPSRSVLAIYFGYTTCQRSCPTALNSIAEAIDRLGKLGAAVQPVFIDMDPERVALVSIPAYMEAFGSRFLGLTGSSSDVRQAAKSFKVKVERIQLSADPTDY